MRSGLRKQDALMEYSSILREFAMDNNSNRFAARLMHWQKKHGVRRDSKKIYSLQMKILKWR